MHSSAVAEGNAEATTAERHRKLSLTPSLTLAILRAGIDPQSGK
jgi:hypothetical protein